MEIHGQVCAIHSACIRKTPRGGRLWQKKESANNKQQKHPQIAQIPQNEEGRGQKAEVRSQKD
jgi:hypothetical protein